MEQQLLPIWTAAVWGAAAGAWWHRRQRRNIVSMPRGYGYGAIGRSARFRDKFHGKGDRSNRNRVPRLWKVPFQRFPEAARVHLTAFREFQYTYSASIPLSGLGFPVVNHPWMPFSQGAFNWDTNSAGGPPPEVTETAITGWTSIDPCRHWNFWDDMYQSYRVRGWSVLFEVKVERMSDVNVSSFAGHPGKIHYVLDMTRNINQQKAIYKPTPQVNESPGLFVEDRFRRLVTKSYSPNFVGRKVPVRLYTTAKKVTDPFISWDGEDDETGDPITVRGRTDPYAWIKTSRAGEAMDIDPSRTAYMMLYIFPDIHVASSTAADRRGLGNAFRLTIKVKTDFYCDFALTKKANPYGVHEGVNLVTNPVSFGHDTSTIPDPVGYDWGGGTNETTVVPITDQVNVQHVEDP